MTLEGWNYRKSHIITHPTGGLTNYQTKIRVYRTTGTDSGDTVYVGDKCRADFGDIRFTNSAGVELDYWMETNAGSYADFWVEIDSIGTTTTIYIYYGNSSATTTSNGDATFVFFDDFTGTSLNTSKWNPTLIAFNGGVGTIAVNNTLTITNTNSATGVGLSSLNALGSDSAYRIRTKINARSTGSTSTAQSRIVLTSTAADPGVFGLYNNSSEGRAYLHQGFGIGNPYISETFITSTPRIYDYECKVANPKLYKDNTLVITGTGTPTAPSGTYIRIWTYSTSTSATLDWICARAYAATEPTHSTWGAEQDLSATDLTIRITPTSGTDPLSVAYNVIIPEGTLTNFTMNYGDGNEYTSASQVSFATAHTYSDPGTYTVWAEGYNGSIHKYYEIPYGVTVTAPAVVASFTTSQSYNTITFTNTSTGNINECYWVFGDGQYSYETSPIHTYYSPATYNVTLYTSNQYQYSATTMPITISQVLTPPNAYFTPARLDVVNPTLPYNVTFTNLSTPTFGCTYNWTVDGGAVSTSSDPTISFATHGVYDIGLTVTNSLGSSSRVYNDAIRLTRKSRTMNEVVGGADTFSTFGVQVFLEYATGSDLPLVYATILPEGVYFIQREIPDVPGIDEWGVRHLYSTINEWGIKIFNTINSWGHKILHNSSSVDRTPLRCIDVEIFEETINISDDHQFDEDPS